jgi:hypothetical protein
MKHFLKIDEGVDVSALLAQLDAHPELWDQHTVRKTAPGTPHSRMSDIWVRYNNAEPFESGERPWAEFNDEHVPVWYEAWGKLPALRKIIFDLMSMVDGEMLGGVLITRIPPGMGIDPHTDASWHVSYYDKFYVSLRSEPGAEFICWHEGEREALCPSPGDIWLFDNKKMHAVENTSASDRITLIVCIRTDKYRSS